MAAAVAAASEPIVLSYDNAPTAETETFIKTLKANRWNYRIVGGGDKWEGFLTRMKGYHAALQTLADDQIVVLSDARDVLCTRGPKAFLDAFSEFGRPMVVSMELVCHMLLDRPDDGVTSYHNCMPLSRYWKAIGWTGPLPSRKYVNAGLICGRADALRTFFSWAIERGFQDDQLALGHYMCTFPDRVAADHEAKLLHTTNFGVNAGVLSIHLQKHDSPTFAEVFGRAGFFVHFPGANTARGNACLYSAMKLLLDSGYCDEMMRKPYGLDIYPEPKWNEKF